MKRLYITGICGLLGNGIVKELSSKYEICGVDISEVELDGCVVERYDLQDKEKLKKSICIFNPDVVIHTAAAVNVDRCECEKEYAYTLNVEVTKNISEICKENNIKLIYISTDAVYDGENETLYIEGEKENPINYYGETKLQGELAVKQIHNSLTLRTNIYGLNIQNKKSFGEWIVSALLADEELNMFTDVHFSPILVNELANIIDLCIEKNLSGLYHACGTGSISKYDFGMLVKDIFQITTGKIIKSTSDKMNFKAKRSKNMGMSNDKLCNELNIKISTPEESILCFKNLYYTK